MARSPSIDVAVIPADNSASAEQPEASIERLVQPFSGRWLRG